MAVFKCKMCGASLDVTAGESVVECEYCGSTQTLPRLDDDKRANLYDRADHFRRGNDYDKAMSIYEKILEEDTTDAEAYWSIVLCRFGIEYVEDPTTHKRIPTVNRMQSTSILADEDYKQALSYADGAQRAVYEAEANTIADIQKGILEISSKEKPYDVFICYKETDENGRRTQDSVLAQDLYYQLTQEGFKVFFSRITLEDKLGTAYEPYIFAALNSAKVMVAVGTKPQYFNAVWVKNEWSRYLALMKKDSKKMLVPAYKGMDPYDIPEELSHLQAQDMSKLGFMQDLVRGIKKILADDKPTATVVNTTIVNNASNANIEALLKRANLFLEDGDFGSADEYADKILDINPEYAEAYLVKLLAELHLKKKTELGDYPHSLIADNYTYQKILRFGDEKLKAEMLKYEETNREKVEGAVQHIDGITYERLRDLSGYICSSGDKSLVEANIQSTVLGLPVNRITKEAFSGCSSLKSITIPDSVGYIGNHAFWDCSSLGSVTFAPNSNLTSIGSDAFNGCTSLIGITIPSSVTSIGNWAFKNCESLTNITLPYCPTHIGDIFDGYDSVRYTNNIPSSLKEIILTGGASIGDDAFRGCSSPTSITIPSSVTSIGDSAFSRCSSLTSITIPSSVTSIGDSAFSSCSALTSITIPSGVTSIGNRAFEYCRSLTSITIPSSVTSIGHYAFAACRSLTSVKIPDSVTSIGHYAFATCRSLPSITIPESVTSLGYGVFGNSGIRHISLPDKFKSIFARKKLGLKLFVKVE